jgi:hypothetical protein
MMYKVPMPSRTNGVKLHTFGDHQIGIEYETGEPHVGPMAYDSSCGILSRNVTFRRKRPDLDKIIADARRKVARDGLPRGTGISRSEGAMEPRGSMNINDEDPDDDDGGEIVTKLMSYLQDKLSPEQLSSVAAILSSADDAPDLDAGEPRQATDRRRASRLAADAERTRPMSARENREFDDLFPAAKRILIR